MPGGYATAAELGYAAAATRFEPGAPLKLDESYRRAHLPLVAPGHPDIIAADAGRGYAMGRHDEIVSLVAPIDADALEAGPGWRDCLAELHASPLAAKIAWDILPARRGKLHVTLCGTLSRGVDPVLAEGIEAALCKMEPIRAEVRGVFSGTVNVGRLYLKLHPWRSGQADAFQAVQAAFGRPPGALHLMGLINLTDHLDPQEAGWLAAFLASWEERLIARVVVGELWLMGARDDLVLDSRLLRRFPLG